MSSNIHHEDFKTKSPYSTPKLSLSKLPNKPIRNNNNNNSEAPYTTPPFHPTVTIPFQWEEAPGKPKVTKSKTARCLDLPPRLTLLLSEDGKTTNTSSPTTVLDGPYVAVGRSFSSINEAELGDNNNNNENITMRSGRWESFKENENNNRGVVVRGNFEFCDHLNSTSSNAYDFSTRQRKFLRKGSFFNFSRNNSNLLVSVL